MLQTVRKYTHGWVATVMGLILSFAFVLWGIENYISGNSKKNLLAKVNGKEISSAQVNADYQRMIVRLKEQVGAEFVLPPLMQQQLKQQALNNLIMQNVLVQAASKTGFAITPQETAAVIKQMPAFQEPNGFSREKFNLIVLKMGYSEEEFFADVSKTLLLNQVASGIVGSEFVLPNELNHLAALTEQRRDIEYAVISHASFNNKKSAPQSDAQLTAYYQAHKQNFKSPAKIQLEYVQLSADDLKKEILITPEDIKNFFDVNTDQDQTKPAVLAKAKEAIKQQKVEQAFQVQSDKLTDLTYTHPDSLVDAAKALGLSVATTEYFTQEGGAHPLTKNPKVIATAFNSDILKNHANSNLIEIAPGKVVVIRVKNYQSETVTPFAEVKEKISKILAEQNALLQVKQKAERIVAQINARQDFDKMVAAEKLSLTSLKNISRHEKNVNSEVLRLGFSVPPSAKKPVVSAPLSNGDYLIVRVNRSTDLLPEKVTEEMRANLRKAYADNYGKLEYNFYGENQLQAAKIKTYTEK